MGRALQRLATYGLILVSHAACSDAAGDRRASDEHLASARPEAAASPEPAASTSPAVPAEVPPAVPEPPASIGVRPDVVLSVPPGDATRTVDLVADLGCTFARAELELEIDGRPDGTVALTAPGGETERVPLHILTTHHFVRTFDWHALGGLHAARGRPLAGRYGLALALRATAYCGGSCEEGATVGPPPEVRAGELRLWCERAARPATSPTVLVMGEPTGPRAYPGGAAGAFFSVEEDCVAAEVRVEVRGHPPTFGEERFELVAPDGSEHRVARWEPADGGGQRKIIATVRSAAGRASAGIWELRIPRAARDIVLDGASLAFECAR